MNDLLLTCHFRNVTWLSISTVRIPMSALSVVVQ